MRVGAAGRQRLLHRGEPADATTQRQNVAPAARAVAELAACHQLVVDPDDPAFSAPTEPLDIRELPTIRLECGCPPECPRGQRR
jgi:carbamate kinase